MIARRREFIPFFGLILIVVLIILYYIGTTQRIAIRGHFVNLRADTIIQYFGKDRYHMEEVNSNIARHPVNTNSSSLERNDNTNNRRTRKIVRSDAEKPVVIANSELKVKQTASQNTSTPREKFNFDNWTQRKSQEICGTGWQKNYRKLHEDILSRRRQEKYLVYLCPGTRQGCCGYGNRLRAVVSLFYLSVLIDRAFLIDWRAPEPIENHLIPRNIQWNYSEPTDVCTGLPIRKHYWGTTKTDIREAEGWIIQDSSHFKKWLTSTDLENYFDWPVEEITTIWYFAEGGLTLNPYLMKRAKQLGIKPLTSNAPRYNLIGCAFHFLFSKSEPVTRKLDEMKRQLRFDAGPVIGIHIRTGDDQFDYFASDNERSPNSKNISHLLNFFECARKIENAIFAREKNNSSNVRWFVSTDNTRVRQLVQRSFPRKVITSNLTILHLDILFNTTDVNFTAVCNYTDSSNTTLVCYNVEIFNLTAFCLNRTNASPEDGYNSTTSDTGLFTDGIIAMLVDHFLLAESDFLILCDSSFGSTAVGLSMRETDSYTLADRGCLNLASAQKNKRLRYFGRR
ncbi:uncharacterized protein [Montipora capricornis]|uniref:uncharacterized protein n=1 Tax=Montipora capricornis TaxID=246305 RepID=UPI0035F1ED6C